MSSAQAYTEQLKEALKVGVANFPAFKAMCRVRRQLLDLGVPRPVANVLASKTKFEVSEAIMEEDGLELLDTYAQLLHAMYLAVRQETGESNDSYYEQTQTILGNMSDVLSVTLS